MDFKVYTPYQKAHPANADCFILKTREVRAPVSPCCESSYRQRERERERERERDRDRDIRVSMDLGRPDSSVAKTVVS